MNSTLKNLWRKGLLAIRLLLLSSFFSPYFLFCDTFDLINGYQLKGGKGPDSVGIYYADSLVVGPGIKGIQIDDEFIYGWYSRKAKGDGLAYFLLETEHRLVKYYDDFLDFRTATQEEGIHPPDMSNEITYWDLLKLKENVSPHLRTSGFVLEEREIEEIEIKKIRVSNGTYFLNVFFDFSNTGLYFSDFKVVENEGEMNCILKVLPKTKSSDMAVFRQLLEVPESVNHVTFGLSRKVIWNR